MTASLSTSHPHHGTSLPTTTKAASEVSQFVKPFGAPGGGGELSDKGVDLAGDVPFQAADDCAAGHALGGASVE
jgi:hypothetical protein